MNINHNELLYELHEAELRIKADLVFATGRYAVRLEGRLSGLNIARQIINNLVQRELIRGKKEEEK